MAITTRAFGTTQDGQNVTMYTLTNHSGASVSMLDLGAIVTNILVPDKSGKLADVALGWGGGEWMDIWKRDNAGLNIVDTVICQDAPDDDALTACRAAADKLA